MAPPILVDATGRSLSSRGPGSQRITVPRVVVAAPSPPWLAWTQDYRAADPGNIASLFQDNAKTSPVTADGQPVVAIEIYPKDQSTLFDTASSVIDLGWNWGDEDSTNNINGHPVFWFDGTEGAGILLQGEKQLQEYATNNLKFTYHIVFKTLAGIADNRTIALQSGGGSMPGFRYDTDSSGVIRVSGFMSGFQSADVPWVEGEAHVLTLRCDGESGNLYVYADGSLNNTFDIDALGDTEIVGWLGAADVAIGVILFHDGDDADFAAHITDLIDWFAVP